MEVLMTNQQLAGGADIFQKARETAQRFAEQQARIKSVMDRQTQRDVAAARGQMIPFSQADIM
jgi:hypothetical protein